MHEVAVAVDCAPAVVAFLCAYAHKEADATALFARTQPLGEESVEIVVPEVLVEKTEIAGGVASRRHVAHPDVAFGFLPRPPPGLEHGGACGHFKRNAAVVWLSDVAVGREALADILRGLAVLRLIVHMHHAETASGQVAADVVDAQVEQHAAVFPSGE